MSLRGREREFEGEIYGKGDGGKQTQITVEKEQETPSHVTEFNSGIEFIKVCVGWKHPR